MREEMIELNYSFKTSVFQISRSRARGDLRPGQDIASARGPPPSQTRHSRHSPGPRPSARGCRHSRQRREARQNIRKHRKSGDHISDNLQTNDVCSTVLTCVFYHEVTPVISPRSGCPMLFTALVSVVMCAGMPGAVHSRERRERGEPRAPPPAPAPSHQPLPAPPAQSRRESGRSHIEHKLASLHHHHITLSLVTCHSCHSDPVSR